MTLFIIELKLLILYSHAWHSNCMYYLHSCHQNKARRTHNHVKTRTQAEAIRIAHNTCWYGLCPQEVLGWASFTYQKQGKVHSMLLIWHANIISYMSSQPCVPVKVEHCMYLMLINLYMYAWMYVCMYVSMYVCILESSNFSTGYTCWCCRNGNICRRRQGECVYVYGMTCYVYTWIHRIY